MTASKPLTNPSSNDGLKPSANEAVLFAVEDAFTDPVGVFSSALVASASDLSPLIVLDTNALLLPYRLSSGELTSLKEKYELLSKQNRLFIPARVAREFLKNRDQRLAELLQTFQDQSSKSSGVAKPLPPHLRSVPGHAELVEAGEALDAARATYLKAVIKVRDAVKEWNGNDPVTLAYSNVFNAENIIEHDGDRKSIAEEWATRLLTKRPPGYKDVSKDDTGIGDYLIWKVILKLGGLHCREMIFVTGEEKTDWMVRANNQGVYARPELIAEYKAASGGKGIRFSTLANLLQELQAPSGVVAEIKTAEDTANFQIRVAKSQEYNPQFSADHWSEFEHSFDYSTNNGIVTISSQYGVFNIRFSKASDRSIYLYKDRNSLRIARAKDVNVGARISISDFDSSSDHYTIGTGESFLVENTVGALLVGRIKAIADDTRNGAPADKVVFSYSTWPRGSAGIVPA